VIKSTLNQTDYTRQFLTRTGIDHANFDRYHKEWWWNHTDPKNLRLSINGFKFVSHNKIPYYQIELPELLKNRTLIQMSRLLTCPYFIKKLDIVYLLGEEESVLLKLHADNLQQYLDNLQLQ
jgi:hypothetical protein